MWLAASVKMSRCKNKFIRLFKRTRTLAKRSFVFMRRSVIVHSLSEPRSTVSTVVCTAGKYENILLTFEIMYKNILIIHDIIMHISKI